MSQHTPGPWAARGSSAEFTIWRDYTDTDGSRVHQPVAQALHVRTIPDPEREANARLIAAAPDLLAACNFVADKLNDPALVAVLDAAINKAKGE